MTEMTHLPGDDPGQQIADLLLAEVSEELGTDDVAHAFGHRTDPTAVGRLVEDDEGAHTDVTAELWAHESDPADEGDLSAEESAVHLIDPDSYDAALDEGDDTRY
jgi:hypothetical protein